MDCEPWTVDCGLWTVASWAVDRGPWCPTTPESQGVLIDVLAGIRKERYEWYERYECPRAPQRPRCRTHESHSRLLLPNACALRLQATGLPQFSTFNRPSKTLAYLPKYLSSNYLPYVATISPNFNSHPSLACLQLHDRPGSQQSTSNLINSDEDPNYNHSNIAIVSRPHSGSIPGTSPRCQLRIPRSSLPIP